MPKPRPELMTEPRLRPAPRERVKHSHYKKDVSHLQFIDVYRICRLFDVTEPAIQHAVKKLLCAGQRGAKNNEQDYREAFDSISRALQMIAEDCNAQKEPAKETT